MRLSISASRATALKSFRVTAELLEYLTMNSSLGMKIAAAVILAVVIAVYARSGQQPPANDDSQVTDTGKSAQAVSSRLQVEQRLQELHAAHDRTTDQGQHEPGQGQHEEGVAVGGKIKAPVGAAPNDKRIAPQRPAAGDPAAPPGEVVDNELDVDPDDIPALKNIAIADADPERRLAAVTLLGSSEDPAVLPTLAQALSDEDDEVRLAAIQSLSDFTGEAPVELLSKVVAEDPSADNRYEALQALSDVGGEHATNAIQRALNDPDEDVRALAEGMVEDTESADETPNAAAEAATPPLAPTP
jgi:hypothetical protein